MVAAIDQESAVKEEMYHQKYNLIENTLDFFKCVYLLGKILLFSFLMV